ncbi:MAG: septum site-determining protein MinC [Lachnospiraceae bacterium]|nr:septum site-determining protein MinC [Lachnospiraceae bacterium]
MKSKVVIKSFPNGLKVSLDPECTFIDILKEISDKLIESKGFFKGSKTAITFEGRALSPEEEKQLIDTMETAGDMTVLYTIETNPETLESVAKVVTRSMNEENVGNCFGKLYTGSLKKGERLETESGIIIVGDIEPGAALISKGSIVVLGGIYGTCVCEAEDSESKHFIAASNLSPERIRIGKFHLTPKERPKWVIRPKMQSKICYCENEEIVMEPISTDSLKKLCSIIG